MTQPLIRKLLFQVVIWFGLMGVLLFGSAGTLAWTAAWLWLLEWAACGVWIGMWLAREDPGLLAERLAPIAQREQQPWDRVFMLCVAVGFCAWLCLMGVDAVRKGWSDVPLWLGVLGAIAIFVDIYATRAVFAANRFAAPVVKIQSERGHRVSDSGPYAYVRHPMYGFALLFLVGTPLMLGSWWGLACVPFMVVALAYRAVREERTLVEKLPGYSEYLARVRYRFVPGVW
ncbi:methyltransferase family protein [Paraburkholderia unamae]|uniref:Protein-S-isoprenylcysteine O-methyltransferase Ste14 n=1 Tax=Paraburkholderia unamae TaxID=219649 RepID=A0ABX5KNY4_9BURK|nr:isoprenylcysteine carboxylmethyltransferase family protein [Paraburkholderia unamae]PVX84196.1 protein-S-isoprenylcysteine O-methyltransferase Ste14 [Paraburkholderia unamae]CAG9272744.1 Protein-S-isoprenylcysteine O-methyltransferase Ste14 [Paraburkholderia unamae]